MKSQILFALVPAALLASALALAQTPPAGTDAARKMEILEKDILDSRTRVEELASELKKTRATLESTLAYLDAQAKGAKLMAEVLDESERDGFTYGINPRSRETLLRGWREQLTLLQTNVPVLPVVLAPKDAKDTVKKPADVPPGR